MKTWMVIILAVAVLYPTIWQAAQKNFPQDGRADWYDAANL
jgi:hypothetical protein